MLATFLLTAVLLGQTLEPARTSPRAFPFPPGDTSTVNLITWDANRLPPIYERSDQLPLTEEEVVKLSRAGFTTPQLTRMLEQRRCACDASAEGLIRMKEQGVAPEVLTALSTHALAPNRALSLTVTLDFAGESRSARDNFLYVFVDDGPLTRVLSANLDALLGQKRQHETTVDRSDLLRARTVRRIVLPGQVPLKTYGRHRVMVVASRSPSRTHPDQLTPQERASARVYEFDYPRSSVQSECRLNAGYRQDPVLAHRWLFQGSRFECEWN